MSGRAIPEAAVEAGARALQSANRKDALAVDVAAEVLAAAAPHMAGSGEAKRIVAALRSYSDDVDRVRAIGGEVGRISHRLADYIEREFVRPAQPDAERAPGAPGKGIHGGLICLCDPNRTYCPHTEGQCPWWDREPIEPAWSQPDTKRAPQEDEGAMRNRLNALADKHGAPRPNRYTPSAMASQPDAERAPQEDQ